MHDILEAMPQATNYNVVILKRNHQDPIVAMHLSDFLEIVEMLKANHLQ